MLDCFVAKLRRSDCSEGFIAFYWLTFGRVPGMPGPGSPGGIRNADKKKWGEIGENQVIDPDERIQIDDILGDCSK